MTTFQPGQIIYLDYIDPAQRCDPCGIAPFTGGNGKADPCGICEAARLYAEVIQIVLPRQLCWARPLAFVHDVHHPDPLTNGSRFDDFRQGSDLLLPLTLFQAAVDTEVMPILAQLHAPKPPNQNAALPSLEEQPGIHRQLQQFIRLVWQAHPDVFQP